MESLMRGAMTLVLALLPALLASCQEAQACGQGDVAMEHGHGPAPEAA